MLRPIHVKDELHRRPPFVGVRFWCTRLEVRHQFVPAPRRGIFVDSSEVAGGLESISRDQVHEQPRTAQKDLHVVHAASAQAGSHFGPHRLVKTAVRGDFLGVILETEREAECLHANPNGASPYGVARRE